MTFRNLSNLIYVQKYNHTLWKNGFLTFLYVVSLIIFTVILNYIILNHPNEQKDFNLFIGSFTITTVLLTSLITTLIQNNKRNNSIMNEYHDVFEYLRNLNWYLNSGYGWCNYLADKSRTPGQAKTKEDLNREDRIKANFIEMDERIRNIINASSTFPSPLKNQIYLKLDQSKKIFDAEVFFGTRSLQDSIITVFINTNQHVLLNLFLNKYADQEVTKLMGYCFDWLIWSVNQLDFIRQNYD